ncbi:MAG: hypothetical protein ACLSB9_34985 [Hydrogeniiclostridium mannosilyticum]
MPFDDLSLCHCADFRSGNHYADHKQAAGSRTKDFGIFKAIGFTDNIRLSFALRFGIAAALGSVLGTTQRFPHRPAGGSADADGRISDFLPDRM